MVSFLFLIIINFCNPRTYQRIEKDKLLTFNLGNEDSEFYASLDYFDNYEENENEKEKKNFFGFLKINDLLSVNCIILDKGIVEPDETILNATNKTEFCEYEINLNYNKKLINFPKNITQQQKIYFIFFIDEKFKEKFKENEIYEIQRIHSPKFLNYTLDVGVNTKETLIFLFDAEDINGLYFFFISKIKNTNLSL